MSTIKERVARAIDDVDALPGMVGMDQRGEAARKEVARWLREKRAYCLRNDPGRSAATIGRLADELDPPEKDQSRRRDMIPQETDELLRVVGRVIRNRLDDELCTVCHLEPEGDLELGRATFARMIPAAEACGIKGHGMECAGSCIFKNVGSCSARCRLDWAVGAEGTWRSSPYHIKPGPSCPAAKKEVD